MLSHKALETMVDDFMESKNWLKVKVGKDYKGRCRPDRVYTKGTDILVFEIKPFNITRGEIYKGIGQALWYLPYQVKPYLVIPDHWVSSFQKTFSHLPFLGILQYSDRDFSVYQRATRNPQLEEFYPLEIVRLSRLFLWNLLKRICPEDGLYSLDFIAENLKLAYPKVSFYRQNIARVMTFMGYGRGYYNPETMEANYRGKIFYHVILHRNLRGYQ